MIICISDGLNRHTQYSRIAQVWMLCVWVTAKQHTDILTQRTPSLVVVGEQPSQLLGDTALLAGDSIHRL
jgi:hypothetical protein